VERAFLPTKLKKRFSGEKIETVTLCNCGRIVCFWLRFQIDNYSQGRTAEAIMQILEMRSLIRKLKGLIANNITKPLLPMLMTILASSSWHAAIQLRDRHQEFLSMYVSVS
jgi:hypothetical protein